MSNSLLIVDDDAAFCHYIVSLAEHAGWTCRTCTDSRDFEAMLAAGAPDLLMLDIVMPGRDGIELVELLTQLPERTRVLFVSPSRPDYLDYARAIADIRLNRTVESRIKPLRPGDVAELLGPEAETGLAQRQLE